MILRAESASRPPTSTPPTLTPGAIWSFWASSYAQTPTASSKPRVSSATRAIRTFWCTFSLARISPLRISFPLRTNSTFHLRRVLVGTRFATGFAGIGRRLRVEGRRGEGPLGSASPCRPIPPTADADQGPGPPGRVEGDGPGGRLSLSGRGGQDPQLRRGETCCGEARRPPRLEAGPGDQGQSRLPPDPRSTGCAGGRQDTDH